MVIKDCVYCEDMIDDRFMGNLLNVLNVDFLLNGEDILLFKRLNNYCSQLYFDREYFFCIFYI